MGGEGKEGGKGGGKGKWTGKGKGKGGVMCQAWKDGKARRN